MTKLIDLLTAKLPTVILKCPSGRYCLAGSVPVALMEEVKLPGRLPYTRSLIWNTEEEAIEALLGIGIDTFQLSDCSWYEGRKP